VAKPLTKPPDFYNLGLNGRELAGNVLFIIGQWAMTHTIGFHLVTDDPLPAPGIGAVLGDYDVPNFGGSEFKDWTLINMTMTKYANNGRWQIASDTVTFTSANIVDPITVTGLIFVIADVVAAIPLSTPWAVTANGQTMTGKVRWRPDAGYIQFDRLT